MKKNKRVARPADAGSSHVSASTEARSANGKTWAAFGAGAVALFAAAVINRANTRRAETETPPAGKFVEIDGVRLHYVDRGTGRAVVLLHGNAVTLQDFEVSGVLGLAAESYRVIAFDRPGFGYSERPRTAVWTPAAQASLLAKALKQIEVDSAVVVGHSWGTMVALAMALDHPAMVRGLVLISGYYYATGRPDVLPAAIPAIPVLGDLLAQTVMPLAGLLNGPAALKASFAPAAVPAKFADFPKALALRPSQIRSSAAEAAMMVPAAFRLSHRYGELAVPIVVMAGAGDLIVRPDDNARRFTNEVSYAQYREVPEQGHMLHYAVPNQVVEAIADVSRR